MIPLAEVIDNTTQDVPLRFLFDGNYDEFKKPLQFG